MDSHGTGGAFLPQPATSAKIIDNRTVAFLRINVYPCLDPQSGIRISGDQEVDIRLPGYQVKNFRLISPDTLISCYPSS
jgi:hypothetical protein